VVFSFTCNTSHQLCWTQSFSPTELIGRFLTFDWVIGAPHHPSIEGKCLVRT
jgi:hypothetical protein